MKPTNKELATGLKVPPSRITEWQKRGMPSDSIPAAQAWRMIHAPPRGKHAALVAQSSQERRSEPSSSKATALHDDGWEARLDRTRRVELQIYGTLTQALTDGDVLVISKLQAAHVAAVKEIAAAEAIALEVRTASRELIAAATAREIMREITVPLRQAVDTLPITERSNCNPEHPEVAQAALKLWRDRLLVRLSTMETKF